MNKTIEIPESYVHQVEEVLNLQERYFEAAAKAKKTKLGYDFQESKDLLRECKQLEAKLRQDTASILGSIHGKMTADEAIAAMRRDLDDDLHYARKEGNRG
tara:strand:+ start:732 stop:1034 length:303 start_codon:yes stop_codon:yes gene_type:complete